MTQNGENDSNTGDLIGSFYKDALFENVLTKKATFEPNLNVKSVQFLSDSTYDKNDSNGVLNDDRNNDSNSIIINDSKGDIESDSNSVHNQKVTPVADFKSKL